MVAQAEVTYDPDIISATDVAKLMEDMGFSSTLMEHAAMENRPGVSLQNVSCSSNCENVALSLLQITGMTSASCVRKIESKLSSTHSHLETVSLPTSQAQGHYDPEVVGARDLLAIVQVLITSASSLVSFVLNITECFFHSRNLDSRLTWRRQA